MSRSYVVDGAELECTFGTAPGRLTLKSQKKLSIQGKLKATDKDKLLEPPFFGNCTCKSPNPPCSPTLQKWQIPGKRTSMGKNTFIMDNSKIQCAQGGLITVKDVNQDLVATGEKENELDKILPKLEGEIIFAHGYLSNPITNSESHYNAIMDLNPDDPDSGALKGENADEHDRTHQDDIYTADEKAERDNRGKWETLLEDEYKTRLGQPVTPFVRFSFTPDEKYWGYWNAKTNKLRATSDYANYFNASNNEHFINGSHGLGSNGAHRIDHGIAQGYTWAKSNWNIEKFDVVENNKENNPYIESFSPPYKPVTVVGHSQGAATAAGVALGILKYAADMGYQKIPLNIIFLGVHQPKNLTGSEYGQLLKHKTKYLEVDDFYLKLLGGAEESGKEYLNSISDLFNTEYNKLKNERGIYEHLKIIVGDWNAFKDRCVQFTFTNDRADLVLRDGDIPGIDSACNPKRDNTLYSVEFFATGGKIPSDYESGQNKTIIDLSLEEEGAEGFLVLPPYIANLRFDYDALEKLDNPTKEQEENGVEWGDYRSVCVTWGLAMAKYKKLKSAYNEVAKEKWFVPGYDRERNILLRNFEHLKVDWQYLQTARWYAPLQTADLYAHFSPVGLINHKRIVSDFSKYSGDTVGTTASIWERIKKVGENKFYRVEFEKKPDGKEIDDSVEKRTFAKKEIMNKLIGKQINTAIAETVYITNVIKVFVDGDTSLAESLFKEPIKTGGHVDPITPEQKKKILDKQKKELQKNREKSIDNTSTRKIRKF